MEFGRIGKTLSCRVVSGVIGGLGLLLSSCASPKDVLEAYDELQSQKRTERILNELIESIQYQIGIDQRPPGIEFVIKEPMGGVQHPEDFKRREDSKENYDNLNEPKQKERDESNDEDKNPPHSYQQPQHSSDSLYNNSSSQNNLGINLYNNSSSQSNLGSNPYNNFSRPNLISRPNFQQPGLDSFLFYHAGSIPCTETSKTQQVIDKVLAGLDEDDDSVADNSFGEGEAKRIAFTLLAREISPGLASTINWGYNAVDRVRDIKKNVQKSLSEYTGVKFSFSMGGGLDGDPDLGIRARKHINILGVEGELALELKETSPEDLFNPWYSSSGNSTASYQPIYLKSLIDWGKRDAWMGDSDEINLLSLSYTIKF